MATAIEIAKKIRKSLDADWMEELEDNNLHSIFGSIYSIPEIEIEDKNRIICLIIYAYSPDSTWLDLKKDRNDNKRRILESLGANTNLKIYQEVMHNNNDIIGMCTFNYMEDLKNWKWPIIFNLLDYAAKMQRFSNKETETEKSWDEMDKEGNKETLKEEIDIAKIIKANKDKGELLDMAIKKRIQADALLEELKKDFLASDIAVQSDFGFSFTDTAKKREILSWRHFIKYDRPKMDKRMQSTEP